MAFHPTGPPECTLIHFYSAGKSVLMIWKSLCWGGESAYECDKCEKTPNVHLMFLPQTRDHQSKERFSIIVQWVQDSFIYFKGIFLSVRDITVPVIPSSTTINCKNGRKQITTIIIIDHNIPDQPFTLPSSMLPVMLGCYSFLLIQFWFAVEKYPSASYRLQRCGAALWIPAGSSWHWGKCSIKYELNQNANKPQRCYYCRTEGIDDEKIWPAVWRGKKG